MNSSCSINHIGPMSGIVPIPPKICHFPCFRQESRQNVVVSRKNFRAELTWITTKTRLDTDSCEFETTEMSAVLLWFLAFRCRSWLREGNQLGSLVCWIAVDWDNVCLHPSGRSCLSTAGHGWDHSCFGFIVVLIIGYEKNKKTKPLSDFHKQTLPSTVVNSQRLSEAEDKLHDFLDSCQKAGTEE